jgi:thiosulfate dehydrogenase (quinone) large subunit
MSLSSILSRRNTIVNDPPFAQKLFNSTYAAWLWLPIRIWLGWQWVEAAMHKVNNPAWVQSGEALKGFWTGAIAIPAEGRPAISFDWYRSFLTMLLDAHAYTWFAKLIAYGELLIGIGLIVGAFTGFAAFFGALMNFNFMLAGSASTNPVLFILAVGVMLAWKVSGLVGADYFLLPTVGTPWKQPAEEVKLERTALAGD